MRRSVIVLLSMAILGGIAAAVVGVEEKTFMPAEVKGEAAKPVAAAEPNKPAAEMKLAVIKLEKPNLEKGVPLMKAFKQRKSDRQFSDKKLTSQQLAEILWAANGVNRDDGKRTVPSAMNKHPMDIYAVLAEGIYSYDPAKHELAPVAEGDFRDQAGGQAFVKMAPLNIVFVADLSKFTDTRRPGREMPNETKMQWAALEAGCQVQNVYLYCASEGLSTVVRGMVDKEKLAPTMKLKGEQAIICAQTVGWPK
jgi:SagB-type dehydrogenase family enzyme